MQHVEFFHRDHFELRYHRKKAKRSLAHFIDFFWETDFDTLYDQHPEGFSDALFPNIGYTYLINLGTPFSMQLGEEVFDMRSDGFLPRHKPMICHHSRGNRIFGIKFHVSPVIFEKKINFSEYREYIFPLAYLIDRGLVERLKEAPHFDRRVELVSEHYDRIVQRFAGSLTQATVVTDIIRQCLQQQSFQPSVEELAARYGISTRTLQRYFEATTSIGSKQALQILRIRKALQALGTAPQNFDCRAFGYYDHSHFHKHLKGFLTRHTVAIAEPHLRKLKTIG